MAKVAESTRMCRYSPRLGRREKVSGEKYHETTDNMRNEPVRDVSRDHPLNCPLVSHTFLMPLRDIISHEPHGGHLGLIRGHAMHMATCRNCNYPHRHTSTSMT